MKKSKYCNVKEIAEGVVVTNVKSGTMVLFSDKYAEYVKIALTVGDVNDSLRMQPKIRKFLYETGLIVDDNEDEEKTQLLEIEKHKNNTGMLGLIIMPTDDCNFRCPYCYEDHIKSYMSMDYLDRIAKFVDLRIDQYRGLKVEWFGGEPLLQLNSIYYLSEKLVKICKSHKKPFLSAMTTNGYYLTIDVFEKLKKLHFLGYQITVDGMAETHDKQRFLANRDGTWNKIIKNLRDIRDTPCRGFTNICIRSNFTSGMLPKGKEFIDFLNSEFGNDRRFSYFIRTVADFGGERINYMKDKLITDNNLMIELQEYASSLGMKLSMDKSGLSSGGQVCYAGKRNYYILCSDEIVRKSTCEYDNPLNHLGYITEEGELIIDRDKENLWVDGYSCKNTDCQYRITCCGNACPRINVIYKNTNCVWNERGVSTVIDVLSKNTANLLVYNE